MDINLTGEDINRVVAEAIIKSAVGEHLKNAIERVVQELSKSYSNPFDNEIKMIISQEMRRIVEKEYGPVLREKAAQRIREALTDSALDAILEKLVNAAQRSLDR